ncbi:PB1 domain containing protein [Parasponia andersonii]|uniref:PB1 domain containing protein n=1 Tax=Parasponia andersonii TaxID=3476 RepID=A0A2P5ACD9_PARAD|nr:PB1 domain containing protein [Parasponia andersonii]
MEPPPPPAAAPATATAPPPSHHLSYPDSVDSSPRSRNTDSWDEPLPPAASRLRLMCSYGGHIVPRPHDKSLCYVGGETRIVVVDRNTSLADLSARLSKTLLNGRSFTLKYQLPSEDLDSLISVTTDEDLDNMIDEYDRTAHGGSSAAKPSRLRLFLFASKPESSQSIGPILDNPAKSEDWFLNALNGAAAGLLNRGFSDSASVNCLLGLDDDVIAGGGSGSNLDSGSREMETASQPGGGFGNGKGSGKALGNQDVHSVPDSPMLETTSSFGSTSSSPSLANLPPIRVHVEDGGGGGGGGGGGVRVGQDHKVGIEEQFAQMSIGHAGLKQDESSFVVLSSPPPLPATIVGQAIPLPVSSSGVGVGIDYASAASRVISDDERSDHGVPIGYRKQPPPQALSQPQALPPQSQQKSAGVLDLPSPDSVSSDNSIGNALSRSKPVIYQDPVVQFPPGTTRVPANPVDPKVNLSDPSTRVQIQQQVQDSGYVLQTQFDPKQQQQQHQQQQQQAQQFVHAGAHYIHHHPAAGTVPISAYYPVYPSQQQHHPHRHHQLDQQYPVYYVPARQPQAYNNLSVQQPNISEASTGIPSSHPQTHPNPAMVAPPTAAYNPVRNPQLGKPEIAAGMYRTATTVAQPSLVQVPSAQHPQQYVGYSQIHHPSQSVAPSSAAAANYAYEYADPAHTQIYYTQPLAPTMTSQYQTMTGTGAVVLPDVSGQLPADSIKQQMRTSQPS